MSGKKRGPKPTGKQTRDAEISCSLTPEDAEALTRLAEGLGFKSRSEMCTAIFERLIVSGWAPVAWLKLGWQFRSRAQETGFFEDAGFWNPFRPWPPLPVEDALPRPTPPMPEEQMAPRQTKALLAEVRKELVT